MKQVTNIHKTTHTAFMEGHINICKNIGQYKNSCYNKARVQNIKYNLVQKQFNKMILLYHHDHMIILYDYNKL